MTFSLSECQENKDYCIINLEGKMIDGVSLGKISEVIKKQISEKKNNFILDLGKVNYIDSSGLGFIIQLLTKIRNKGGELYLTNISKKIDDLLVTTKLKSIFTVAPINEIIKNSEKQI